MLFPQQLVIACSSNKLEFSEIYLLEITLSLPVSGPLLTASIFSVGTIQMGLTMGATDCCGRASTRLRPCDSNLMAL